MSIFGKIRDAIFGRKKTDAGAPQGTPAHQPTGQAQRTPGTAPAPAPTLQRRVENLLTGGKREGRPDSTGAARGIVKLLRDRSTSTTVRSWGPEGLHLDKRRRAEMNIWLHKW